jgi:hypothetical protein
MWESYIQDKMPVHDFIAKGEHKQEDFENWLSFDYFTSFQNIKKIIV